MGYQPIHNYGIVGNMYTTALVGLNGSIDWFCFPSHDSPSVFAGLLDVHKGGHFKIAPIASEVTHKQFYWPETNVLLTRFLALEGVAETADFMPAGIQEQDLGFQWLIRRVRVIRGNMDFVMECYPAFNYARDEHQTIVTSLGAVFLSSSLSLALSTEIPLRQIGNGVQAKFTLHSGETAVFVLRRTEPDGGCGLPLVKSRADNLFKETVEYWRHWLEQCTYKGRWREIVHRSALVLKLLTYEPTGAIIASPTCSLPEKIGGERNWDYRYTWIRDAAFTVYALLRLGFTGEAAKFMNWIGCLCHKRNPDGSLQPMYGIDGRHELEEEILEHLEGYKGSKPVRIGNAAYKQLQMDIYGELMDSIYLYNKYVVPISYDAWNELRLMINWICDNWQRKDRGLWEVRGKDRNFVYSKLMCWVAVDRGLRLADKRSFPAERERWLVVRDQIYEEIMAEGWNDSLQAFVQSYGSDSLDASNLIIPLILFLSPTDPRMLSTIDAINKSPEQGGLVYNSLVYRYNVEATPDGLTGEEGTFNLCTFWLVEALARAGQVESSRLDDARLIFEDMLGHANHLGLFAEETDPTGRALGNFPLALTHLSLISAAYNLNKAIDKA
ncbi:glycoside hydrolase family 15 protein [Aetokthonos hydrillicola Thurmond2011]|uniref:Glycoside hydrolase family 15 protein n=1 Tax=Aetokthonos hydrillicola Thurmond2011 TaxID=2712845 RepID=A0AAP5IAG4_9CYAN|nr:glycoside hydrolase family 15 protein [Aetokthonos hydrillicola]MBO3460710.1 glycoside hydrolase family 15 protein [Aetokthonos hydrillicola CCALA 1050]MBW4587707.1 glycoside hydrolase family 15 protein [Aetokthonos hydrillicola CCALA 1050]MDR9897911.1 glycoside hydrolase family 15 protein [Aetokthonos hydrillicola Thurmond2011]